MAGALPAPATGAETRDAHDLAAAFGAREAVSQVSLSPDGRRIAFVVPANGRGDALYVVDVGDGAVPKRLAVATGAPERLAACRWATNDRLVCVIFGQRERDGGKLATMPVGGFRNLVALPASGGDGVHPPKQVALGPGTVVDWVTDKGGVLVARGLIVTGGVSDMSAQLVRYDLDTGRTHPDTELAWGTGFVTDGLGHARVTASRGAAGTRLQYRDPGGARWKPLGGPEKGPGAFTPEAVDPATNLVWGMAGKDGRRAVFTRTLDGAATQREVYARADVDVGSLVRIGRRQRIVGVGYVTDTAHVHYTDPAMAQVAAALARALPDTPDIRIADASDDERRLLILAASARDPGRYYLLDRDSHHLQRLMDVRPEMAGLTLVPVTVVRYPAPDGTRIPAYLTLPAGRPRPGRAIVLPHGGPSARDDGSFDWLAQFFAARGYAVLQPEFRGSAGFGEAFRPDGGYRRWPVAIGDIDAGARWLVAQGIASADALAVFGWSYGGYAALQAGAVEPDLYRAVVAVAPVTDLAAMGLMGGKDAKPDEVPPTVDGVAPSPVGNAARIKAPVMLVHGTLDRNVPLDQSRRLADALTAAGHAPRFLTLPGLDHQLDEADARRRLLVQADEVIAAALPH